MPRLRTDAPDLLMVEAAAELSAAHGASKVSLQDVADAVGVTKAAVLHHFGSKAGLEARVAEVLRELIEASVARVRGTDEGPLRDARAVEAVLDCALEHPGIAAFCVAHADDLELRTALFEAFDDRPGLVDAERTVRVSAALAAIGLLALVARREGRADSWRPLILRTCAATLRGDAGNVSDPAERSRRAR